MKRRTVLAGLGATAAAGVLGMPSILKAQAPVTLNGAVQFNDDHAFTKALVRFEELVKKYYGKPVNFTLHKNSSLGLEKQYFEYMSQGKAVDPTRDYVDGGQMREPITEGQRKAVLRLNRAERELGADGAALVHDVLVQGMTMEQVGERRGLRAQRWKDYFVRRFRECLDRLALIYGFATEQR